MTPLPIEDYAVIGDCETAALVGRDGSIDWLCLPRFDYPACFAALLGTEANGRWRLAPAGAVTRVRRAYRDDTLVLETEFETGTGVVAVVDFMPPRVPEVVRVVEGRQGRVAMSMELVIRFDYARWCRGCDAPATGSRPSAARTVSCCSRRCHCATRTSRRSPISRSRRASRFRSGSRGFPPTSRHPPARTPRRA
jgi:Domain of unknown function (DUF5911)